MGSSNKITLVAIIVWLYMFSCVSSTEFEVGGEDGWIVPTSKTRGDAFNQWASDNRFQVGDTLRFKYSKDSVLMVSEEEYKKCKATKPQLYSNNEDTVFKLDRPGLFYFISGVSGHCEKGQKMIVKVMETESSTESPPPSSSSSSSSLPVSTPKAKKSNAFKTAVQFSSSGFVVFAVLVVSVFGLT
ncbi:PREDICTED: early nodulin-like protein 1 [Camelina sativa]|uniref:Early nodulin-like protein 1 n=1 Tax=Camelina sativa TaxID=90675 RepID=A0ABM0XLP2_CAMSA|nr:PREDICTED: early nodulin-like protein 1 [Camelina sativa]